MSTGGQQVRAADRAKRRRCQGRIRHQLRGRQQVGEGHRTAFTKWKERVNSKKTEALMVFFCHRPLMSIHAVSLKRHFHPLFFAIVLCLKVLSFSLFFSTYPFSSPPFVVVRNGSVYGGLWKTKAGKKNDVLWSEIKREEFKKRIRKMMTDSPKLFCV